MPVALEQADTGDFAAGEQLVQEAARNAEVVSSLPDAQDGGRKAGGKFVQGQDSKGCDHTTPSDLVGSNSGCFRIGGESLPLRPWATACKNLRVRSQWTTLRRKKPP